MIPLWRVCAVLHKAQSVTKKAETLHIMKSFILSFILPAMSFKKPKSILYTYKHSNLLERS